MPLLSPYDVTAVRLIEKAGHEFSHVKEYLRFVTLQENLICLEILQLKCARNFI